ncbi:MAG: molybdopterin-guanine dinucleotide biosynthesis protein B [Myxococcaceae bacterium]|nr:molybdopterin-guanine dinucleotide biosynthesis protein B [Myxococcaceae bacterium]
MALMPLEEAVQAALTIARPLPAIAVPVAEAEGFVAEPVRAPRDVPACDNSAMDGYAVRAKDTVGATRDRPARLKIVETLFAGQAPRCALGPGEAARIFTGAPIPEGADAVVRQEATRPFGAEVEIGVEATVGEHIRRRGEEIACGAVVFPAGQRIDAYVAGVLATLGFAEVRVRQQPRVAIVTVGDELVAPGQPAAPHQVFDSNAILLARLCRDASARVVSTARTSDDEARLEGALADALARGEVLITCGGASVGDRDRVKAALRRLGADFVVDGVALKPGKPVGVARLGGKIALVLPGNPGAAAMAFDRIGRPLLLALQGVCELRRRSRVRLDADRRKQPGLTYFLSAKWGGPGARVRVRPQGAGQLLQNVEMDGWVRLPAGRGEFRAGEWVDFEWAHAGRFVALEGGAPARHMRPIAVSVVGWSGAGKTCLIERLIPALAAHGWKVAALKHTPDAHPLDRPGSDTERFARAGATAWAIWSASTLRLSVETGWETALDLVAQSGEADLILVEGWKDGPLPKIEVRRPGGGEPLERPETMAAIGWDEPLEPLTQKLIALLEE